MIILAGQHPAEILHLESHRLIIPVDNRVGKYVAPYPAGIIIVSAAVVKPAFDMDKPK